MLYGEETQGRKEEGHEEEGREEEEDGKEEDGQEEEEGQALGLERFASRWRIRVGGAHEAPFLAHRRPAVSSD